jgi:hypothetical protein
MKKVFLSWDVFQPKQIRMIKILGHELTLIYRNNAEVELEFGTDNQLDFFVNRLLASAVEDQPEYLKWN